MTPLAEEMKKRTVVEMSEEEVAIRKKLFQLRAENERSREMYKQQFDTLESRRLENMQLRTRLSEAEAALKEILELDGKFGCETVDVARAYFTKHQPESGEKS